MQDVYGEVNRRGPDFGTQYRTAIFFHTPSRKRLRRSLARLWKPAANSGGPLRRKLPPQESSTARKTITRSICKSTESLPAISNRSSRCAGEPALPRSSRVKESLELAHKPGEWERLSLTNQRAPGALGRPKCDSLPVVSRAGIRELRRAQFSAATAFAVTGCGSANCSQKPIISSSLGSPQRTALDGSGFKGLLLELSK